MGLGILKHRENPAVHRNRRRQDMTRTMSFCAFGEAAEPAFRPEAGRCYCYRALR